MNDLKAAARAGDTKALAQLMNQSFASKGISVKVAKSGPVLKVLMECDRLPDRKLAGAVRKGLDGIKPAGVEKVFLKAQGSGGESWTEVWNLSEPQLLEQSRVDEQPAVEHPKSNDNPTVDNKHLPSRISSIFLLALACSAFLFAWNWKNSLDEPITQQVQEQAEETKPDPFDEGIEYATNAANLAQTAEIPMDWERVVSLWSAAIDRMEAVPGDTPNKAIAQQKAVEYGKNLEYAQQVVQSFIDKGEKLFQELNGDYFVMGGMTDNTYAALLITQSQWNTLSPAQKAELMSYAKDRINNVNINPGRYLLRDIPSTSPIFDQLLEKYRNICADCWAIMVSYSETKPYGLDEVIVKGEGVK